MKILSETEKKVVDMEFDMTDEEMALLVNYAMNNIGKEEMDKLLINWALLDILKKQFDAMNIVEEEEK